MNQNISTIHTKANSEPDESIVVNVLIGDRNDGVKLRLNKTKYILRRGTNHDPKEVSTKTLEIKDLSYSDFEGIAEKLLEFLESKSKPTLSAEITDFNGEYTEKKEGDTSFTSNRKRTSNHEFDSVGISVGEYYIDFWSLSENENWQFKIPASDEIFGKNMENHNNIIEIYYTFVDFFQTEYSREVDWVDEEESSNVEKTVIDKIEFLFERFEDVARPLKNRSRGRDPVSMSDEYDVQYLLHGLLKLYFDDVRDEEYLKRHTGINPRIDFLLESHSIGIEVKRPSEGRSINSVLSDLYEDKEIYRGDSRCEKLLIFIYDPDRTITNAAEFEMSLSEEDTNLETRVTIVQ